MKKIKSLAMATLLGVSLAIGGVACDKTPAHVHSWGEWDVTEATCTVDGEKVRVCETCGEEEREVLTSQGHSWGEWETVSEAKCGVKGLKKRACPCEEEETEDIPALSHNYVDGICENCSSPVASVGLAITENETYCTVTGLGECADTKIVIPSDYNGKPVTAIAPDAFKNKTSITSVYIPDSVTSIGSYAFAYCSKLTEIRLSETLDEIENRAFLSTGLKSVVIPDSVTYIGTSAFHSSALESLVIGDGVTYIDNSAFASCSTLYSVVLGEKVGYIHGYGFQSCNRLMEVYNKSTELTFTAGTSGNGGVAVCAKNVYTDESQKGSFNTDADGFVTYTHGTEKYLINYLGTATEITTPTGVTEIIPSALEAKTTLQSVTVSEGVVKIGRDAFYGCSAITTVSLPSTLKYIGSGAFSAGFSEESVMTSATFKATSGWTVTNGITTKNLSSSDLSDKSLAAKMLTQNPKYYLNYTWTRN